MEVLVWADENGIVSLEDEAKEFVALTVGAIRKKLRYEDASFDLMPYRHGGFEFLGFDWSDSVVQKAEGKRQKAARLHPMDKSRGSHLGRFALSHYVP